MPTTTQPLPILDRSTPTKRSLIATAPRMLGQYLDVQQARLRHKAPATLPLLSIETTLKCNASCAMCGYPSDYPAGPHPLSTEELLTVIDEAAELGALVISLGGGEPFMRKDTETLIRRIDQRGMTALVHSNGSLLNDKRCRQLSDIARLVFSLSLDSHRGEVHDRIRGVPCFERILNAARCFARPESRAKLVLMCTLTRHNYREMVEILKLADSLGVKSVRFTPVHSNLQHRFRSQQELDDFQLREAQLPELAEQIEAAIQYAARQGIVTNSKRYLRSMPDYFRGRVQHRCYAGYLFYAMDPFGNLFPCYDHQGGVNVRELGGLTEAYRSEAMDRLRHKVIHCQQRCWNVGTAEPSLKMDPLGLAGQLPNLLHESLLFLR